MHMSISGCNPTQMARLYIPFQQSRIICMLYAIITIHLSKELIGIHQFQDCNTDMPTPYNKMGSTQNVENFCVIMENNS